MIVQVALETEYKKKNGKLKQVIKRGRAKLIVDYSTQELSQAIDEMISQNATIVTGMWTSYPKAVNGRDYPNFLSERARTLTSIIGTYST